MRLYRLTDARALVREPDYVGWRAWMDQNPHIVAHDVHHDITVITRFTGFETRARAEPPEPFQTVIIYGDDVAEAERYATWDAAVAGHAFLAACLYSSLELSGAESLEDFGAYVDASLGAVS